MNKEQQGLLDEAYKNYCMSYKDGHEFYEDETVKRSYTQEEFINKIKTDDEFSEKWGLKIEERELTTVRERKKYDIHFDDLFGEYTDHHETLDKRGVPRKLITITYKDKTIESYE
jgi:hypothetical protein